MCLSSCPVMVRGRAGWESTALMGPTGWPDTGSAAVSRRVTTACVSAS